MKPTSPEEFLRSPGENSRSASPWEAFSFSLFGGGLRRAARSSSFAASSHIAMFAFSSCILARCAFRLTMLAIPNAAAMYVRNISAKAICFTILSAALGLAKSVKV